ncbi:chitinase-3-like protein 1 [Toxorhynchites rutilus septentrionalis]|uniref:chitinase-3-like protein 1 n=1 Tax=Toxorhynchites rutilus septentrionalis TaxID=329112 RepID=UPI00247A60C4|nr:chitinase-3-like protein 1 [Toxorhynchites rutilus septentrionalis]
MEPKSLLVLSLLALFINIVFADKKIVCYVGTWAVYRPGLGRFDIENINPFLCTHLIYGFFGINEDGSIRIIDPYLDLEENWGRGHVKRFNALKSVNPSLKTMAAVGGWNEGSRKFSLVAASSTGRRRFIEDSISFCKKHNFDGVDLDWEYPGQRDGNEAIDKENHAVWLQEIRSAFDREGLLLSAAVASVEFSAAKSYDIPRVSASLHFINVMTYDMYGAWDNHCGLNAPMYEWSTGTNVTEKQLNVNASIHYWLSQGAPKEKLVMGIPLYGRSFTLANAGNNFIGAPASGPGIAGPYSRELGVMGYNELCEAMLTQQWQIHFDDEQFGFYATKGNQWVGYDNPTTVAAKVRYLMELDLGGVMVWSLETDDFRGVCNEGTNVLMNTIYENLHNGLEPPTTISTTSATKEPNQCSEEGMFPDPEACEKYYICTAHGNRHDFTCPSGLHFDPVHKVCNWPELVNCVPTFYYR